MLWQSGAKPASSVFWPHCALPSVNGVCNAGTKVIGPKLNVSLYLKGLVETLFFSPSISSAVNLFTSTLFFTEIRLSNSSLPEVYSVEKNKTEEDCRCNNGNMRPKDSQLLDTSLQPCAPGCEPVIMYVSVCVSISSTSFLFYQSRKHK